MRPPLSAWHRTGVDTLALHARDGTPLRGWILRGRPGAPWLVLCFGNAGSMQTTLGLARWFTRRLNLYTSRRIVRSAR